MNEQQKADILQKYLETLSRGERFDLPDEVTADLEFSKITMLARMLQGREEKNPEPSKNFMLDLRERLMGDPDPIIAEERFVPTRSWSFWPVLRFVGATFVFMIAIGAVTAIVQLPSGQGSFLNQARESSRTLTRNILPNSPATTNENTNVSADSDDPVNENTNDSGDVAVTTPEDNTNTDNFSPDDVGGGGGTDIDDTPEAEITSENGSDSVVAASLALTDLEKDSSDVSSLLSGLSTDITEGLDIADLSGLSNMSLDLNLSLD